MLFLHAYTAKVHKTGPHSFYGLLTFFNDCGKEQYWESRVFCAAEGRQSQAVTAVAVTITATVYKFPLPMMQWSEENWNKAIATLNI